MKTLKEIVAAINALPVEAFKNDADINAVGDALTLGARRWSSSAEYDAELEREERQREQRAKRDTEVRRARDEGVRKWLENGTLTKGMFVKVTGARDGHGIRELIEVSGGRLVCRQWMPVRIWKRDRTITPEGLRALGYMKLDGEWMRPEQQMTTHDFMRVVKILSVDPIAKP